MGDGTAIDESIGTEYRDRFYDALSNSYRRVILWTLQDDHRPLHVSTLVDALAAVERDGTMSRERADEDRDDTIDRLFVLLTHVHLPKLADAGLIQWDRTERVVSLSSRFDDLTDRSTLSGQHCVSERKRA